MGLVPSTYVRKNKIDLYHWLTYVRNKMDLVPLACVRKEQNGLCTLSLRTQGTKWT